MKIEFDRERWRWSDDMVGVTLDLQVDGAFARAVLYADTLHDLFGADLDDPSHMEEAYLRNQAAIEACVREMVENGRLENRYVDVEPEDLAAYLQRNKIKPEQVSVLV